MIDRKQKSFKFKEIVLPRESPLIKELDGGYLEQRIKKTKIEELTFLTKRYQRNLQRANGEEKIHYSYERLGVNLTIFQEPLEGKRIKLTPIMKYSDESREDVIEKIKEGLNKLFYKNSQ